MGRRQRAAEGTTRCLVGGEDKGVMDGVRSHGQTDGPVLAAKSSYSASPSASAGWLESQISVSYVW